jgi:hypothetical protein
MNDNIQPLILDADEKPVASESQTQRPKWRVMYGWKAIPSTRDTGLKDIHDKPLLETLPFPQYHIKAFTHKPKDTVLGAPIRGGVASTWSQPKNRRQARRFHQTKPVRYIVWHDSSLRRIDKLIKKQLAGMTPEQQAEFIKTATAQQNDANPQT